MADIIEIPSEQRAAIREYIRANWKNYDPEGRIAAPDDAAKIDQYANDFIDKNLAAITGANADFTLLKDKEVLKKSFAEGKLGPILEPYAQERLSALGQTASGPEIPEPTPMMSLPDVPEAPIVKPGEATGAGAPAAESDETIAHREPAFSAKAQDPAPTPGAPNEEKKADAEKPGEPAPNDDAAAKAKSAYAYNWAEFKHLFQTSEEDMRRMDERHAGGKSTKGEPPSASRTFKPATDKEPAKAIFENTLPLNAETIAYIATRFPNFERDPVFLAALEAKAREYNIDPEILKKGGKIKIKIGNPPEEKEVTTNELLTGIFQANSLLLTDPAPNFSHKLQAVGLVTKPWYERIWNENTTQLGKYEETRLQHQHAAIMFVDEKNNAYIDNGSKVRALLAPGETFTAPHAMNVMSVFFAGRFDPSGKIPQNIKVRLNGGDTLSRVFARKGTGKDNYQLSLMLLATLNESDRMRMAMGGQEVIRPDIEIMTGVDASKLGFKKVGMQKLGRVYMPEDAPKKLGPNDMILSAKAREEFIAAGVNVDILLKNWNEGVPSANNGPSVEGDDLKEQKRPDPVIDPVANPAPEPAAKKTDEALPSGPLLTPQIMAALPGHAVFQAFIEHGFKGADGKPVLSAADLRQMRGDIADQQAEMMVYDRLMKDSGAYTDEARWQFFQNFPTVESQRTEMANRFPADELTAAMGEKTAALDAIYAGRAPAHGSAVPPSGVLLEQTLLQAGVKPERVAAIKTAAVISQVCARIMDIIDGKLDGKKIPAMHASADTSPAAAKAMEIYNACKQHLDQGTLKNAAGEIRTSVIPSLKHEIRDALQKAGLHQTAAWVEEVFAARADAARAGMQNFGKFSPGKDRAARDQRRPSAP